MKKNRGKSKKKWIILFIVLALLAAGFLAIRHNVQKAMEGLTSQVETATVLRQDLTQTIAATGLIASDNTKIVKTTLANAELLTVDVAVGDVIAAGQTIATFDTADIAADLANARINLSVANSQSSLSLSNARRGLDDAEASRDYQLSSAADSLANALDAYQDALADYAEANSDLAELEADEADLETDFSRLERKYEAIKEDYQDAANDFARAQNEAGALKAEADNLKALMDMALAESGGDETAVAYLQAKAAYDQSLTRLSQQQLNVNAAQQEYLDLKSDHDERYAAYTAAKAEYDTAKAKREAKEAEAKSLLRLADQAEQGYTKAASSYDYTQNSAASAVVGSQAAVSSSQLSASTAGQAYTDLIDTYSKQLAKGVLVSPISGVVTAVHVEAGDTYMGGAIVTVEDAQALVVLAEIDEYDIADVAVGMKVLFKTDATRDQQLEGKVVEIAPRPSESVSGDITYQVKIAVLSETDRLRLGMSAKVSIIVSETANVLTVPYDAVQADEAGNPVVYVLEEAAAGEEEAPAAPGFFGQFGQVGQAVPAPAPQRAIPVSVGVEGDYFVEISGPGLEEGMVVVLPDSGYVDPLSAMMAF